MKRASLLTAAALIVIANAFALAHAWRNRTGQVQADIVLTERELPLSYLNNEDDSGVTLGLQWLNPSTSEFGSALPATLLDRKTLHDLGFDTSVEPSDDKAVELYRRQRARRVFVAMEFDGPAWRTYMEQSDREYKESVAASHPNAASPLHESETRLVAIDIATDAAQLRGRHPDRNSVLIVPAVVRIAAYPFRPENRGLPSRPAYLSGSVQGIANSIHVPRPFSDAFRRLPADRRNAKYRVHLRYGPALEPWVVGTEFPLTNP
ncbi:MAG: DUF4824 family protein [Bryobacteraceae bacterium]